MSTDVRSSDEKAQRMRRKNASKGVPDGWHFFTNIDSNRAPAYLRAAEVMGIGLRITDDAYAVDGCRMNNLRRVILLDHPRLSSDEYNKLRDLVRDIMAEWTAEAQRARVAAASPEKEKKPCSRE